MKVNDRARVFIRRLNKNLSLCDSNWEVWSGQFNKELRNAISGSKNEEEKTSLAFVFSYWQAQNKIKNLSAFDIMNILNLKNQAEHFKMEALGEKS